MTGEVEDTDVGFPGPEHYIAERELPDEDRDGRCWRCCAVVGGLLQIPGIDDGVTRFLSPTFADSQLYSLHVERHGPAWLGLVIGALIAVAGIVDRLPDLDRRARHLGAAARAVRGDRTRSCGTSGTSMS